MVYVMPLHIQQDPTLLMHGLRDLQKKDEGECVTAECAGLPLTELLMLKLMKSATVICQNHTQTIACTGALK